ncbi:HlyD family efflux transporter periplasmic adaptor subunit [Methylobacterium sp. 1030]|uniref:HlyD family efflux transporter periplasmic adaptor subunit n=1 Tax=Methylobacterium sp. 1030 TaxID=3156404 RepID=UPI003398E3F2
MSAAESLLTVVPDNATLELEAVLPHREAGFVREGQPAEVKLEAFPFTRFGTVPGQVRLVSQHAVGGPAPASSVRPTEPEVRGATEEGGYRITVALDRTNMEADGRSVPLRPGMAAQADIVTGTRRVIALLLDPIVKHSMEAGHER